MDKESVFEKDGKCYVLQAGIEYVPKNRSYCIRRQGDSKTITIQKAIQLELIREVSPVEKRSLFTNAEQQNQEKIEEKSAIADPKQPEYRETPEIHSKNDNFYFMSVDQLRAQVFLAHGLIYPAVYDKAGLSVDFHDNQRQTPASLTLYETPQPLNDNQLLLRILLHPNEITAAEREGDVLRLRTPLPISRLAGIGVPYAVGGLDHYINGWVKPDVPVPRHLFTNADAQLEPDNKKPNWNSQQEDAKPIPDIVESIIRFDRYLGVMAFLRNAERYFSEKTGHYADYPDVFFAVCERIVDRLGLAPSGCPVPTPLLLALFNLDTQINPAVTSLLRLANSQEPYIEKEEARRCASDIYKATGEQENLKQAFKLLFSGDYRSAIPKLQSQDLPVEAAVLAGLFHFSVRQSNGYRTVKQRLHEDWSNQTQVRLVLATLGAYYGYTTLDARETSLYSVHPLIRPLIEENPEIKFHLKTHFERQLIEALYQRAFFPDRSIQDFGLLFNTINAIQASPAPKIPWMLVSDATTYTVQDLVVRQYEVTRIGRFIQQFREWKRDIIDEKSRVGRYLMSQCFFLADEYEISKKAGRQIFSYRISKNKVINLIIDGKITVDPVLEAALKEDFKDNTR